LLGWVSNVFNGDLRAIVVPFVVAALFLYAAWQVFSGLRDRRRRRAESATSLDEETPPVAP
jgi:signal peptidase I